MYIRIFSKKFFLRIGSPLWWILTFLFCGGALYIFLRILWMVG